ncbi:major facilitator superfamily transporter pantothenate [Grosmannia clavigera kw1407]|uniref:Major facilitator superfamily transporter pantothenate n=1 Tax=Grosmannia clavigera (strain kw1407 / UAMH 11150) TaxID=655863 RepID=F0XU56_GROCL|nr:major facilitator superfamily transporter pantothenate [Grosmannia clavigera kw1407]EFW98884.1 major facilitator superfamily transporter pantothenate [Grosmannia clavigera kw1407]
MGARLHNVRVAVWGEAPETAEERKTYCCVAYFFNYLDRAVLANAYVSGMKDDIHLKGNEYQLLVTCLSVGYIIGQVPHGLAIQKIAPRIWFPSMTLIWACLTMASAGCNSFGSLATVRFLQGIFEASTYSGTQYVIGSWYKSAEIGKRVGLFQASGMVGTMFSGVMMTAIWKTMDGVSGMAGWRWSFIIDGVITIPVAIFGFIFFPDLPETTSAFYLKPHERELAVNRLPPKNPDGHRIGFSLVKRVLFTANFWIFTIFWVIGGALEAFTTQSCMLLWMKASKLFSVPQNNTYPLGITAVAIDATRKHAPFGFFACAVQIIACIVLLCWNSIGMGGKMAGYYLAGTAYMIQPVTFIWANIILSRAGDDAARAVTLYSMNGAYGLPILSARF